MNTRTLEITGRRTAASWEKQTVYKLSNRWRATVEYNHYYGEFISRLDHPDGTHFWCCSDGLDNKHANGPDAVIRHVFRNHVACPDFAREWLDPNGMVRPSFTRN